MLTASSIFHFLFLPIEPQCCLQTPFSIFFLSTYQASMPTGNSGFQLSFFTYWPGVQKLLQSFSWWTPLCWLKASVYTYQCSKAVSGPFSGRFCSSLSLLVIYLVYPNACPFLHIFLIIFVFSNRSFIKRKTTELHKRTTCNSLHLPLQNTIWQTHTSISNSVYKCVCSSHFKFFTIFIYYLYNSSIKVS